MKKVQKIAALVLACALMLPFGAVTALADGTPPDCHPTHEGCSYVEAIPGTPCNAEHEVHTEDCSYTPAAEGVDCDHSCVLCAVTQDSGTATPLADGQNEALAVNGAAMAADGNYLGTSIMIHMYNKTVDGVVMMFDGKGLAKIPVSDIKDFKLFRNDLEVPNIEILVRDDTNGNLYREEKLMGEGEYAEWQTHDSIDFVEGVPGNGTYYATFKHGNIERRSADYKLEGGSAEGATYRETRLFSTTIGSGATVKQISGFEIWFNGVPENDVKKTDISELKLFRDNVEVPGVALTGEFEIQDNQEGKTGYNINFAAGYPEPGEYRMTYKLAGVLRESYLKQIYPPHTVVATLPGFPNLPLGYSSAELEYKEAIFVNNTTSAISINTVTTSTPDIIELLAPEEPVEIAALVSGRPFKYRPVGGLGVGRHTASISWKSAIDGEATTSTFVVEVVDKNKPVPPPSGGGDDSSSSGGSSSGGSIGTPTADKPSSNVDSTGKVKQEDLVSQTTATIADAIKAGTGSRANIVVQNAAAITPQALKEMSAAATKAGGSAQLMADSVVNGKIEARLYINPALAGNLANDIQLGVKLDEKSVKYTIDKFVNFDNEMAVASFAHQGEFGLQLEAAVKVDLTKLNTQTLRFYSYDKATNKYYPIAYPNYRIDKAGYLHFNTARGGDIVITDKPLTLKNN